MHIGVWWITVGMNVSVYDKKTVSLIPIFMESTFFHSIAYTTLNIEEKPTDIIVITLRGTKSWDEKGGNATTGDLSAITVDWLAPYKTYGYFKSFANDVISNLSLFYINHPEISKDKKVKVLITEHSLGGAAAHILTGWLNKNASVFLPDWPVWSPQG